MSAFELYVPPLIPDDERPSNCRGSKGSTTIVCPDCGGPTAVTDSRRAVDWTNRRRICLRCGERFPTRERVIVEGPS